MKYTLIQVVVLAALVGLMVAVGRAPVVALWGPAALTFFHAAAVICLIGALLAAIPLGVVATYWPAYTPHAAFAGTGVRLLGTAALGVGYQVLARPDLTPFLLCLSLIYLVLLLAETALIVYIVLHVYVRKPKDAE